MASAPLLQLRQREVREPTLGCPPGDILHTMEAQPVIQFPEPSGHLVVLHTHIIPGSRWGCVSPSHHRADMLGENITVTLLSGDLALCLPSRGSRVGRARRAIPSYRSRIRSGPGRPEIVRYNSHREGLRTADAV